MQDAILSSLKKTPELDKVVSKCSKTDYPTYFKQSIQADLMYYFKQIVQSDLISYFK